MKNHNPAQPSEKQVQKEKADDASPVAAAHVSQAGIKKKKETKGENTRSNKRLY